MSAGQTISKEDISVLLASALGQDKSGEIVTSTAKALGITRTAFTPEDVRAIFDVLVKAEGLVGVVARFAVSRRDVERLVLQGSFEPPTRKLARPDFSDAGAAGVPPPAPKATFEIAPLIAPALGNEKAREAIEAAAALHGVDVAAGLSYASALLVLDEMTTAPGIVGVVARFAKARFLLNPEE